MAEKSMYWYTDGFTGAIGDGSAPYTQEEQRAHEAALFGEGVIAGQDNELAVSVPDPLLVAVQVATGRAQVAGFHYWNDAAKGLAVTLPSVGTTGGRVVLRADWTTATTRAAILLNTDGVATLPALTQTVGVTYEISLASFTVTTGGVIALTDTRQYIKEYSVFLPTSGAFNADSSTSINVSSHFGVSFVNTDVTQAYGFFVCPNRIIGNVTISAVIGQAVAGAGNVYIKNDAYYTDRDGDLQNDNPIVTSGYAAVAVPGANFLKSVQEINVPASAGDVISLLFERIGDNAGDTYSGTIGFLGWYINYRLSS